MVAWSRHQKSKRVDCRPAPGVGSGRIAGLQYLQSQSGAEFASGINLGDIPMRPDSRTRPRRCPRERSTCGRPYCPAPRIWIAAAMLAAAVVPNICGAFPRTSKLRAGEWAAWLDKYGPHVTWGERPIVVGGYVRLYRPKYRGSLVHTFKVRNPLPKVEAGPEGGSLIWQTRNREYSMKYVVELAPPHVTVTLDAAVEQNAPLGGIEFAAFFLPPRLIAGARGRVRRGGQWTDFTAPVNPTHNWNVSGSAADKIILETPAGRFTIEDLDGARLRLSDMRLNPNYRNTAPYFWVFPAVSVPQSRRIHASVRLTFEPSDEFIPLSRLTSLVFPTPGRTVPAVAPLSTPLLFPPPKRMAFHSGILKLHQPVALRVPDGVSQAVLDTADLLRNDLAECLAVETRIVSGGTPTAGEIWLSLGKGIGVNGTLRPPEHAEGYTLIVDEKAITVCGSDLRGLYYGTRTLLQLVRKNRGDGNILLPQCRIDDWPALRQRAVHPPRLWPSSNLDYFRRYFNLLAAARFNLVVWEISGSVRFPDLPWMWREQGSFDPEEIREIINAARRRRVEMIPELECLGHVREWLGGDPGDFERFPWLRACFENQRRTDLCVSNPKTLEVTLQAMDAVSDLFDHPRFFHVGLDESWGFATCPKCSQQDPALLLAGWLKSLYDHLAKRKQTMMMWHDMLLSKHRIPGAVANGDRTERAVDLIPRDIVICNWQYHPGPAKPSTEYFQKKGFPVLVCPWYDPDDVLDCTRTAHDLQCGILSTNWNAFIRRTPMPPFAAVAGRDLTGSLLAAEYAWIADPAADDILAGALPSRDLTPDERILPADATFRVIVFRKMPDCPGFPTPPGGTMGRNGTIVVAGIPFLPAPTTTPGRDGAEPTGFSAGAAVRGVRNVPVHDAVTDIYILAALRSRPTYTQLTFEVRFHYADSQVETVPLSEAAVEMGPFFRRIGLAFRGRFGGFPAARRYCVLRVRSPRADAVLEHLDIVQSGGEPVGLVVAGVTVLPGADAAPKQRPKRRTLQ